MLGEAIGGFGRLQEMLVVIKQVGGVERLKDLLEEDSGKRAE